MILYPSSWAHQLLVERLIEESGDGIFVFDREQRYVVWNPVMERLFGLRADRVLGCRTSDIFGFLARTGHDRYYATALAGEVVTLEHQVFRMPETGRTATVHLRYVPLTNRYSHVVAVLGVVRDASRDSEHDDTQDALPETGLVASGRLGVGEAFTRGPSRLGAQGWPAIHRVIETEPAAPSPSPPQPSITPDTFATTAHELRTPINAILGYVEVLTRGIAGPLTPEQYDQLGRIATSARHLLSVANHVLELAKAEAKCTTACEAESYALPSSIGQSQRQRASQAVSAAITLIAPQAAAREITVSNGVDAMTDTWYYGDLEWVTRILVNLLSNAVKFTPPGGRIVIFAGETAHVDGPRGIGGRWTYLRVDDTGMGIPPEQLETVFEPFVQARPPATGPARLGPEAPGGTGLGLAISRQLARQMGGDVTVTSTLGAGSRFTLWLPVTAPE